eukprot:gene16267-22446_t
MRRLMGDIRERLVNNGRPMYADVGVFSSQQMPAGMPGHQANVSRDWQTPYGSNQVSMSQEWHNQGFAPTGRMSGDVSHSAPFSQGGHSPFARPSSAAQSPFASASAMAGALGRHTPTKVRVYVDEEYIRSQERQKAVDIMSQQVESLKAQTTAMRKQPGQQSSRGPSLLRKVSGGPPSVAGSVEGRSAAAAMGTAGKLEKFLQERMSKQGEGKGNHQRSKSTGDLSQPSARVASMTEQETSNPDLGQLPLPGLPPPKKFEKDKDKEKEKPPLVPGTGGSGLAPSRFESKSLPPKNPSRMSRVTRD